MKQKMKDAGSSNKRKADAEPEEGPQGSSSSLMVDISTRTIQHVVK